MTDEQMDDFFVETLKIILNEIKEAAAYVQNMKWPEYDEIKEDYKYAQEDLEAVLDSVKNLDDLAECDGDTVDFVYGLLEAYADNLIIREDSAFKKQDMELYSKVEEILNLFMDTEDEEAEDEEE